jgi:hypothetical protein
LPIFLVLESFPYPGLFNNSLNLWLFSCPLGVSFYVIKSLKRRCV